jgi:hypothetical protein
MAPRIRKTSQAGNLSYLTGGVDMFLIGIIVALILAAMVLLFRAAGSLGGAATARERKLHSMDSDAPKHERATGLN